MTKRPEADARPPEDCPTAWFVTLERARRAQDFALAAKAERELQRLGVRVKYTPARKGGERHA